MHNARYWERLLGASARHRAAAGQTNQLRKMQLLSQAVYGGIEGVGSRVSGLLERSPGESHRILWLAAVRFGSLRLRCVGFGSIRFGSVFGDSGEARVVGCSSSIWADFAAQLAASTASGFQCAFNNKFNCLHDVGKVQRRGVRGWGAWLITLAASSCLTWK